NSSRFAAGIIIVKRFRQGKINLVITAKVGRIRQPGTVRCFMADNQAERFIGIAPVKPRFGLIRNNVCYIPFYVFPRTARVDEIGIIICPLSGQNAIIIESLRMIPEVLFTDPRCLVAYFLQSLNKQVLTVVECGRLVIFKAIFVAVFPREQRCAARPADGVGYVRAVEPGAFVGNSIDIWRLRQPLAIGSYGLESVVVRNDK